MPDTGASLSVILARQAYSWALRLGTPAYLAKLWQRGAREPLYRQAIGERFGLHLPPMAPGALWLHAVSLGETRAAAALVAALRAQRPGLRLLLTHGTATGREAGQALLREGDQQLWLPFDTPGAVHRFLRHAQPALGVLMETEIWPNLLHAAAARRLPMVLANARLSDKSARRGQRLSLLMRPAADALNLVLAQTEADAQRLRAAGAADVRVCGNLKYDLQPDGDQLAQGRAWRAALSGSVVAAVNTREGEEEALLARWATWPSPRPQLLLVPRHPQRFDAVADLVRQQGFSVSRRSQWGGASPAEAAGGADVWLGDSLGEMALYYGLSDLALLGGSFAPLGGHNLIESAACGCPIILGPSTFNFAQAAEGALAAGAAWRATGWDDALDQAGQLLAAPQRLQEAAEHATAFASAHRGAATRMASAILSLLPAAATPPRG
ncbi:3-deoxy-D-manno-octulosonic acid transferase [Ideonella oryzae]|uniref:3-deoxy-D-manno-octulosonic acid transferase n=1 Tax=Ideonella oryzae TaxID=2937441 RepID=A0ABT1BIX5_9BURK|nr:3-deoxy-D-manno-octulosonic acid transferase [Ideonella oryzae]MCO5976171.1 3-deoxy-D-manno-octulosonic acid transferase [Ideonella oryzae]